MKKLDETSISEYGINGLVLMENAGVSVVNEILKLVQNPKRVLIVCGTGNNGGDGFVIARHLMNRNWQVSVLVCGNEDRIKGDSLTNLKILKKLNCDIVFLQDDKYKFPEPLLKDSDIIVDALLGTGFAGQLKEKYINVIRSVNRSGKYIVSVDIPSGLYSDSGFCSEECIKADITVTFQLAKLGLLINDGPEVSGRLVVSDISIPRKLIDSEKLEYNLIDTEILHNLLKERRNNTHKGSYGRVLTTACSKNMSGSGIMAAKAALRSGAGISVLAVPRSIQSSVNTQLLEVMSRGLEDNNTGVLAKDCIENLLSMSQEFSCMLIGPGLAVNEDIKAITKEVICRCKAPLIIDADALNVLSKDMDVFRQKLSDIVITPHPGEMARLLGISTVEVQKDRVGCALKVSSEYGITTVLKGHRTIVALPNGELYVNPTGNPGMATAGAGDVLAGIIAGLIAQGLTPEAGAIAGVYIHGAAGDAVKNEIGEYGLTAGDILTQIPHTIKNIVENGCI